MKKQERKIEKTVSGFILYGFAGWEHLTIREVIRKAPTPATVWGRSNQQKDFLKGQTFMVISYTKNVPVRYQAKPNSAQAVTV